MSSAGRELHAAGPGDALPASAAPWTAPGAAGERPGLALPREPHGRDLGARPPLRRRPSPAQASPRQQQEMRGGGSGLERPGWGAEGPREGARPGLPTCGGSGRPGEKEFQLSQKGRERLSSPSCLEIKDLLQNLEGSPAKGQAASEKPSGLPEDTPGMKADGTGLYCNPGEPRAQARTGACSGGVAVSGKDSLASREPLPPDSSEEEEEEVPACARQAGEEKFRNEGQETNAAFNSRPSVQPKMLGTPSKPRLALPLDVCPPGPRLESTGQTLQGSAPWGERMDVSVAACEVQEGSFKSNPSVGRMEDLGAASGAGSPRGERSNHEHKGDESMALSSSPRHKGINELQKGPAVGSCYRRFPLERGRFRSPAGPLTVPKDQHSDIGRSPLGAVVQAAFEDEPSSIQDSLHRERRIPLGKGNGARLLKRKNFGLFQNSCSLKSVSAFLSCLAPQLGLPLRVEPRGHLRTALPLALPRVDSSSFRLTELSLLADGKSLKVPQLPGPLPLAQKAGPSLGPGGPLGSLSPEGVTVMPKAGACPPHKKAPAPSHARGRLQAVMKEGAREMVGWVLRGAGNGEVAMEPFGRKALRLSDRAVSDLSSAPEEIFALARNLFFNCKTLQKGRRRAAPKISFSLGISPALLESSARFFSLHKFFSCSSYRNNWVGLETAGSPLDSAHPLEAPCSDLSKAEAEKWPANGGEAFFGPESVVERSHHIFPPLERGEVHKASLGPGAVGMKTREKATGRNHTRLLLQLALDGDLSRTSLLCRATFRKGQCLEEQYRIPRSSPAWNLSYLNKKDSSLCPKRSARQRQPIYQMKIFLYPCYFLDSCTLFEQKNDSPKTEFLGCQQPSLIFYKKRNNHDLQTLNSSAIKYARCSKNQWLHSKVELKVTPPVAALLTEYHQGPFPEIIIESSSNSNKGSEFTGHLLDEDFLESQSPRTLCGCPESSSESWNRDDFAKNRAPLSKADHLPSASESIHKSPPEKFNFKNRLLSANILASSPFQTASAKMKGQERMKGLLLQSYRKRKTSSLISAGVGSQNKKMCFFPKEEAAFTFPSLKPHSSPLALLERGADGHNRPLGLESEREKGSPGRDTAAAFPRTSSRTCQRLKGPRAEATGSLDPLEPSLEAGEDLGADPREAGRTAGMAEGCPVRLLSDMKESSETLPGNSVLPSGGGKVPFPFKAGMPTGLPLGSPEDISESDSRKAKDSPEPSVTWWYVERPNCALQAKLFSASRKAAETLGSSASSPSGPKDGRPASSPTWPSVKGGHLLRVESGQELAGGPEKGPDERIGRGDSEAGPQLPPPKAKPQAGRRLALGEPPGNSSNEKAEGRGGLARGPWASLGRAGQKRWQQEPPFPTPSESKRQKRGQRYGEKASLNLRSWDREWQANRFPCSLGAFGSFARALGCGRSRRTIVFGSWRLQRPFPALGKVSGTACVKAGMPHRLRAPKPLASKGPPETFPGEKGQLADCAQLAAKQTAPQALLGDPPAKQRQGHWSSSLAASWLTGQAKDAALLTRLSWLAEKLRPPPCQPFPPRRAVLPSAAKWGPLRRRRRRRRKRLEIFSFVSLKLSSPPWPNSCSFKMLASQRLPVYSVESTILCFFELSSDSPRGCSTPVFPGSFHHQVGLGPPGKLPKTGPPSLIPRLALESPRPRQPSARSPSSLLPRRCPDITPIQTDAQPASTSAPKEGKAVACSPGCPTPGLPTALALFSPGCFRAWTRRRRRPSSRIPAVQRLSLLQFARGFRGLQCCTSVSADLFSSWPSLLGSGLSTWRQHRSSTHLSESTPLHSSPSKGQAATASLSHRTSSPSLSPLVPGLPNDPSRAVKKDVGLESILSVVLPTSCQAPEPAHPPLGFPALGSGDEQGASARASPKTPAQLQEDKSQNRPKKVSQIRIRKTIPKPDPNLTPMGLPRPKRLKKTEFSLEEIYTNQNYKSPPATRCLETIFEEPKEKNGSLISISQQKRKRILEFQDFTIPRKRRARSRVRVTGGYTRAQKAAIEGRDLDILLIQKLTDLEAFFAKEETQEQASSCS